MYADLLIYFFWKFLGYRLKEKHIMFKTLLDLVIADWGRHAPLTACYNQVVKLTHSLFWSNIWYWHCQAYFNYVVEHWIYLTISSFIATRCWSTYTGGVVVAGIVLHSFLIFQSGYSTCSTGSKLICFFCHVFYIIFYNYCIGMGMM